MNVSPIMVNTDLIKDNMERFSCVIQGKEIGHFNGKVITAASNPQLEQIKSNPNGLKIPYCTLIGGKDEKRKFIVFLENLKPCWLPVNPTSFLIKKGYNLKIEDKETVGGKGEKTVLKSSCYLEIEKLILQGISGERRDITVGDENVISTMIIDKTKVKFFSNMCFLDKMVFLGSGSTIDREGCHTGNCKGMLHGSRFNLWEREGEILVELNWFDDWNEVNADKPNNFTTPLSWGKEQTEFETFNIQPILNGQLMGMSSILPKLGEIKDSALSRKACQCFLDVRTVKYNLMDNMGIIAFCLFSLMCSDNKFRRRVRKEKTIFESTKFYASEVPGNVFEKLWPEFS